MKTQRDKYADRFADYMIEAMARTRLRQSEIARLTGLSRTTISNIVGKKPHTLSGKLILPERETVDRIARAFGDPVAVARQAAGYSSEEAQSDQQSEEPDRQAEAIRTGEMIQNWTELSPERQAQALEFLKFLKAQDPEAFKLLGPNTQIKKASEIAQDQIHVKKKEDSEPK